MLSLLFLNKSSVAFLMLPFPKMFQGLASSKDHSMTFGNKKGGKARLKIEINHLVIVVSRPP